MVGTHINVGTARIRGTEVNSDVMWIFLQLLHHDIQQFIPIPRGCLTIGDDSELDGIGTGLNADTANRYLHIFVTAAFNFYRILDIGEADEAGLSFNVNLLNFQ